MAFYSGQKLGAYVLEYRLGVGGAAEVWAAHHERLHMPVALKLLRVTSEAARARLLREGRAQTALQHPNILPVRDILEGTDLAGLILPLVEGVSLRALLQKTPLTESETVALIRAILDGLAHAHHKGLVHRDLKPGNILLDLSRHGVAPRIADFGLVKGTPDEFETEADIGMGTPKYAAPEQQLDAGGVDHRADLFSLGVLMVEMLTGKNPFNGRRLRQTQLVHRNVPPLPGLDARWKPLCSDLLQYDAAHRPQDCDAVRRRIAAIAPTPAVDALRGDGRLTKTIRRMVQQDQRARKAQTLQTTDVGTRADLPSHNLPLQVDRFVGRSRAIETLHRLIDRDARLITILGPGGAGKTRLASFFGRSILQGMPGGVWFCDLSEARACADVANAVARSMKLFVAEGDLLEQIGRQLATSGRSLLIVDNFEQVAACAQETIGRWRALAPDTIFLVTSRVHLGLSGEQLLPLAPLPEPEAISLFIERAQQRQPDFHQTTHNREDIQAIVQRLDGLPLAVELAAARVPLFGVQALRQQLSERLEILQDSRRPLRRHTNLHHAVQWSYDLLAPWEQSAFVQLSVFEGGFTLEAAEAILERSGWDPPQSAMDALQSLLDKSLLQRIPSTVHHLPPRFGMLASTQSFARTRLQADPMVNRLYRRHAAFYSSLVPIHVGRSHNGLSLRQRQVLFAEVDNLRAAQRRVTARDEPVMAGHLALVMTHYPRGDNMFTDRALALEQALDGIADQDMPHLKNHLLCSLASYRQMTGQLAQAEALLHAALQAAKQTAIPLIEGFTLLVVARFMSFCNRFKDARQRIQEAQAVFQSHHSHNGEAWAQLEIGRMWFKMGQMKHAATHARAALRLFQQTGDWKGEADACRDLGISILEIPNPEDAIPHFLRALQVFHESGFTVDEGRVSNDLGNCFRAMNRWQQAESYYRAALKIYRQSGDRFEEGVTLCNLGTSLNNRGKTEEAIKLFQRGLRIHRQIPNSRVLLSLLNNLSLLYASRKDYITAREMLEEAITQPNPKTQSRMIPMMRLNLGAILFKLDEPGAAAQYLQEAVSYAHSMEDAVLEGLSLAQLGLALGQLGHITRGRACFEQAEALLRPLRAPHRLLSLLCAKVIFEAPNDYAVASETFAEAERLMETFELNQNIHTANEIQEATHALQRHAPVTFADEHYA